MIKVKKLNPLATFEKANKWARGYDLTCTSVRRNGIFLQVNHGVAVQPPFGYWFLLVPRSSLPIKHGLFLSNSIGIIDPDYRGEWKSNMLQLPNPEEGFYESIINKKVCQAILMKSEPVQGPGNMVWDMEIEYVEELEKTERGSGGFGSTTEREIGFTYSA